MREWEMTNKCEDFSPFRSYRNAIITFDSCFDENREIIPFSPIRRGNSNWEKCQHNVAPDYPEASKYISDAYFINYYRATHWGHFVTETLGRMHPLFCGEVPTKNIVIHFDGLESLEWIKEALSLQKYNIIPFRENLRVGTLHLPVPTMINMHYILKEHIDTLKKYGSTFHSKLDGRVSKLYLSRTKTDVTRRYTFQELELQSILEVNGWTVIHPQEHTIGDQIYLLSNCDYLCGCVGSAFHTLMMSKNIPKKVIYLTSGVKSTIPNYAAHDKLLGLDSVFLDCQKVVDWNKQTREIIDPLQTFGEICKLM